MKLEKAHKQLQKETMEQLEKARKADDDPHKTPRDADADGSLKHQLCHLIIGDCDTYPSVGKVGLDEGCNLFK